MKKLTIILALISGNLMANDTLNFKRTIEVEIDPLAYILKGYSIHGIFVQKHLRFDLGCYAIETPGKYTGNANFNVRNSGFGLKVNYMIKKVNGLYMGLDAGIGKIRAEEINENKSDFGHNISLGSHIGYRLFLFSNSSNISKGIYITPWMGISYNNNYEKVQIEGYTNSKLGYFAACHIGYRF